MADDKPTDQDSTRLSGEWRSFAKFSRGCLRGAIAIRTLTSFALQNVPAQEVQTRQKRPDRQRDNPKKRPDGENEMNGSVDCRIPKRLIGYRDGRYLPHVWIDEGCQSRKDCSYEQKPESYDDSKKISAVVAIDRIEAH